MFPAAAMIFVEIQSCYSQIFHYTCCNTPKRVTSLLGPSPRHCTCATQLLSKKCCSGDKPLATLSPIWPARDLNLRLPAPETKALPLDQLAGWVVAPNFCNCCLASKNVFWYLLLRTFLICYLNKKKYYYFSRNNSLHSMDIPGQMTLIL